MTTVAITVQYRWAARHLAAIASAFLLVGGCLLAVVERIGEVTGATLLPRTMAAIQASDPKALVLPGELRHWGALKLARIAEAQPEVVLIGSSRGNEFRSAMFKPYRFHNAALTAWNIDHLTTMLDRITQVSQPSVVMVGLDYFMFTNRYADSVAIERGMYFDDLRLKYQAQVYLLRSMYKYPDLFRRIFPDLLRGVRQTKPDGTLLLGIDAIRAEAGFRYDGSFVYPSGQIATSAQNVADNKGLLEAFPGGPGIDGRQMRALERLAALARNRGTKLIALQLPIFKASVDYLDQGPSNYSGLWRELQSDAMMRKFDELGIPFFDLSRLPVTADGRNFVDAAHPTESGDLAALLYLAGQPRFRAVLPKLETDRLRQDLAQSTAHGEFVHIYRDRY